MRLWRLPQGDRRVVLLALLLVPVSALALPLFRFRCVYSALEGVRCSTGPSPLSDESARVRAHVVRRLVQRAAERSPVAARCLCVSLVAWTLLRLEGLAADLHLGVRRSDRDLKAHAWVECGGVVLDDSSQNWSALPPLSAVASAGSRR